MVISLIAGRIGRVIWDEEKRANWKIYLKDTTGRTWWVVGWEDWELIRGGEGGKEREKIQDGACNSGLEQMEWVVVPFTKATYNSGSEHRLQVV